MNRPASPADLAQLDALLLAPGEKAPHGTGIGAAGVGIGDRKWRQTRSPARYPEVSDAELLVLTFRPAIPAASVMP